MHKLAIQFAVAVMVVAVVSSSAAQRPDEVPLGDVVQVIPLLEKHKLIAVDARTGGQLVVELKAKERVLWTDARGKIGVALTSQRVLAYSAGASAWDELIYAAGEQPADAAQLGDRLAIVVTDRRVIGFNGHFEWAKLAATEKVTTSRVGDNVAVVVTTHRALGLSPTAGDFVSVPMEAREQVAAMTVGANLATVTSDLRVRVFRAPSDAWEVRRVE